MMIQNNSIALIIDDLIELSQNQKIAIAVSGGQDSMFLLSLCVSNPILLNNILVFHINHQTRQECTKESSLVKEYCNQHNIPFYELITNTLTLNMPDFENQARLERYRLFKEHGTIHKVTHILTAHHQDDLIETVFLKLFRGSLNFFIPKTRQLTPNILIYRPLLSISKKTIQEYISYHNIPYIEDPSNQHMKYLRNYLRLKILPLLQDYIKHLSKKILSVSNQRVEEEDFLNKETRKFEILFESLSCPLEKFLDIHPVIQQRLIQSLAFSHFNTRLSRKHLLEIIQSIKKKSTKSCELLNTYRGELRKESNSIRIIYKNQEQNLEKKINIIHNNKILQTIDDIKISLSIGQGIKYTLDDYLYLQLFQDNDYISWNKGRKKINDLLKDKKVPLSDRKNTYLIIKNEETVGILNKFYSYIIPQERSFHQEEGLFIEWKH